MGLGIVNTPGAIGVELAETKKLAREAKNLAEDASKAAETAQKTADKAHSAVTKFVGTIFVVPSQSGSLTYNGSAQSLVLNSFDSEKLTLGGKTSATDAGTYNATVTPKEGYHWEDGTQTAKTVTWTIKRAVISDVPTQKGSLTYTGSAQSLTLNNYDSNKMTLGGDTSKIDAGSYSATVTPKSNYQWDDGSTSAKTIPWTIGRASLTVPSQSGSLTYNGSAQSVTLSNYDSNKMTLGGTTSATNAGSQTATVTPKANYQWSDGTTTEKSVTWSISKAAGSLSLDKTSMALSVSNLTGYITPTRSGDGVISATSSNTSVATVNIENGKVKVTAKASGSATITVNVGAGTNHTAPASKTCAVTVTIPSATLANNTPETIQAAAKAGVAPNYWSVGDKAPIALNGTVGSLTLNGTYYAFIIGFNHNSSIEGNNSIHFQFGKTSNGTDIAFCDEGYDKYYGDDSSYYSSSKSRFVMKTSNKNGGWKSSYMRNTICPAFLSVLPTAWQNIIVACPKYSDNTGNGYDTASYVTSTSDKIWPLSEFEVFGTRTGANSAEQNYQKQYSYYANGNSKVKYKHSATTVACKWLLRSVQAWNTLYTRCVGTNGDSDDATVIYSYGFAPGFKVA